MNSNLSVAILYVNGNPASLPGNSKDLFVESLERRIEAIKQNRDWEAKFMLLEEMMKEERSEGRIEGQERINCLIKILAEKNRLDDLVKAAGDKDFQQSLFDEFDL